MSNKYRFFVLCTFFILMSTFYFSCKKSQDKVEKFPEPLIKAGIVKVFGKLYDPNLKIPSLILRFKNPITADETIIETSVEKDGNFHFEVPIECSTIISSIYAPGYGGLLIELTSGEDFKVELKLDNTNKLKADNVNGNYFLTIQDKMNFNGVVSRFLSFDGYERKPVHEMTFEQWANYQMELMKMRTEYAMKDDKYSVAGKIFTLNELQMFNLTNILFEYKQWAELYYDNNKENKNLKDWMPKEPDFQYYTFLNKFDLSNPQLINTGYYSKLMQLLLSKQVFNIPAISETLVEVWLTNVKTTLSNLLGFNTGQFYDILAANAYAKQFIDEVTPLSDKQINNIKAYYGDGEIAKILLRKNEEIISLAAAKNTVIVNKTPDVSKEQLMNTIIFKYKNKVVLVDFWATWCGPCLDAMKRIDAIKSQYKDKNIVYVYITNGSSPKEVWDKKIKSISGEHYYVKADEWKYLMESFGFEGIPSYVIFNTEGKIVNKFTSFPGIEKMREMIETLLTP